MEEKYKDKITYVLELLKSPELLLTDKCREWLKNKDNRELYWDMRAAYDSLSLQEKQIPNVKEQWKRLQQSINSRNSGQAVNNNHQIPFSTVRYKRYIVAALVCLAVATGLYFYLKPSHPIKYMQALSTPQNIILNNNTGRKIILNLKDTVYHSDKRGRIDYNTITTPRGKTFTVTLSDGTKVLLNAESSLRYPTSFYGGKRVVELDGEAFFTVAKDKTHPFVVHTAQANTIVTGTKFNFRAYKGAVSHVTLVEGHVAVDALNSKRFVKLQPGEDVSLYTNGQLQVEQIDVERYTAWTEGFFYFEETPLFEIMSELGRWYNVNIYFSDEKIMNYHFNFWVNRNQSLQKALDLLNQLEKVDAVFKNNTIYINQ